MNVVMWLLLAFSVLYIAVGLASQRPGVLILVPLGVMGALLAAEYFLRETVSNGIRVPLLALGLTASSIWQFRMIRNLRVRPQHTHFRESPEN
jgi:hypothetical protein